MLSRMWRSQLGAHFWQKMFGQALGGTAPRGALTELFLLAALLALLGGGEREGGGCGPPRTTETTSQCFLGALRKLLGRIWSKIDNFG